MAAKERKPRGYASPPCFAHELSEGGYGMGNAGELDGTVPMVADKDGVNKMVSIWLRRAYADPGSKDGQRILVDRLWPRGVSKEALQLDEWQKDIAPSNELRKWFDHDVSRWQEFKQRYARELDANNQAIEALLERLKKGRVTLVFAAKDEGRNNAVVLKDYLLSKFRSAREPDHG